MTNLRGIVTNSASLVGAEVATRTASLATIVYLSRTLAPDGMGAAEFGQSVFVVLQLVSNGGVEALLTREAVHRPEDLPRQAGRSLVLAWLQFAVAFGVLAAGLVALGRPRSFVWSALTFGLAAAIVPLGMRFALVAAERAWLVGLGTSLGALTYLGLCVTTVRGPEHAGRLGVLWLAAMAVRTAVPLASFARQHGRVSFDLQGLGHWLGRTIALGIGSVARGLLAAIDILVVGLVCAPDVVARYGLAAKLPLFLASLATLVCTALFPAVVRAVGRPDDRQTATIQSDVLEVVLGVALPGALCLSLVAEPLATVLFSARFAAAGPLLALLVWRVPLMSASALCRTTLWAQDPGRDARVAVQILAVTLPALVGAAIWAGAAGAAWCMLASDVLAVTIYARASGTMRGRDRRALLVRLGGATVLAAALMLGVPRQTRLAGVAGALAVWAVAALVANLPHLRRAVRGLRGMDASHAAG